MDKTIKNLIIDFGGVLINLNRSRCIETFKRLGFTDLERFIDPYHQQGIFMMLEKGELTPGMFRDEIRKMAGMQLADEEINEAWNSFLMDIPGYKLELLLRLRQKYHVYLLSNTNDIHWEWACNHCFNWKGFGIDDYFDAIFLSCRLGLVKPGEAIFHTLLGKTGIDPKETFFIDDAEANCVTARKLGIKTYMPLPGEDWGHLFD